MGVSVQKRLEQLDSCIMQKQQNDARKEARLATLKSQLHSSIGAEQRYHALYRLFSEYESYTYDSAFHYARQAQQTALAMGNRNYQVQSGCAVVSCHLSAGLYKEAFDAMSAIRHDGATKPYQQQYYMMWSRLYYDLANYNDSQPYEQDYVRRGNQYTDTLLSLLPDHSVYWYYAQAQKQMKSHDFAASTRTFQQMIALTDADRHLLAIAYSCIGWNHWIEGREDEAISNLVQSAMCDLQASIKENTSTCGLANILYQKGDIKRAVSYAQSSLEDANFYGARHRKIRVGEILPIVEEDRYRLVERQRNTMVAALIAASLATIILLFSIIFIRRQMRKLQQARQIIEARNQELTDAIGQLNEANKIKNEYIGKTFYLNAKYINKVEKLYKTIDRKITTRQYEDLRSSLKESTLNAERKSMFADFDRTFLKLFPDFIEKYNMLFEVKDRKRPEGEQLLTNEMRIFALIRLGVNDSERIAKFLDYSVHTVNTYKTRIKNRSTVDNDLFEQKIMEI